MMVTLGLCGHCNNIAILPGMKRCGYLGGKEEHIVGLNVLQEVTGVGLGLGLALVLYQG